MVQRFLRRPRKSAPKPMASIAPPMPPSRASGESAQLLLLLPPLLLLPEDVPASVATHR
jgi:hypothetical protein